MQSRGEDFVQCSLQRCRLQCGSEQWICSYNQKTEVEKFPNWVSIYFTKNSDTEYRCNICEETIKTTEKSKELLDHVKSLHKKVYDTHKENADAGVSYRIEFMHVNVLRDNGNSETQPKILGAVCEIATEEIIPTFTDKPADSELEVVPVTKTAKKTRKNFADQDSHSKPRKRRSWIWQYFIRTTNTSAQCKLCNRNISHGGNTGNMIRHLKMIHHKTPEAPQKDSHSKPRIRRSWIWQYFIRTTSTSAQCKLCNRDICHGGNNGNMIRHLKMIHHNTPDAPQKYSHSNPRIRRSWIWQYFIRTTSTSAQCKLCNRNICHSVKTTSNIIRHLKMVHHKYPEAPQKEDTSWIWKFFDHDEDDFYSCKTCQYRCMKFSEMDKSVNCIINHLRIEHGVISGDQIITGTDDCDE